jgi:hypothetical protein
MGIVRVIEKYRDEPEQIAVEVPDDLAHKKGQASSRTTAFCDGAAAYAFGWTLASCPYKDGPGSGSFRKSWIAGYNSMASVQRPGESA